MTEKPTFSDGARDALDALMGAANYCAQESRLSFGEVYGCAVAVRERLLDSPEINGSEVDYMFTPEQAFLVDNLEAKLAGVSDVDALGAAAAFEEIARLELCERVGEELEN